MILELADIRILPGRQADFEAAVRHGIASVIGQARGYRRHQLQHGLDSPERYLLLIEWETLENHTVDFRTGPLYAQWRAIVGPFFAGPPTVEHFSLVAAAS